MKHVCEVCNKGFAYEYLLEKHKKRKIPCKPENNANDNLRCEYCNHVSSTTFRLQTHKKICKMQDDNVRKLEMKLCKMVVLDPNSKTCRFCARSFFNLNNLHRHDKVCKEKETYRLSLLKENKATSTAGIPSSTTIQNITVNINNSIDWNDSMGMREILVQLLPPEKVIRLTRNGDVANSLGNIARVFYSHTDSVICTNLRSNILKCRENGIIVSKNADFVSSQNIEPMIHRVQETDELGLKIPNIDEYNRLDRLTRIPYSDLTKEQKILLRNVLDEQKAATYDAFRNRLMC